MSSQYNNSGYEEYNEDQYFDNTAKRFTGTEMQRMVGRNSICSADKINPMAIYILKQNEYGTSLNGSVWNPVKVKR